MPTFTQEPCQAKLKSLKIIPLLIGLTLLYLVYYFTPTNITSLIPNPFSKKSLITVVGIGSVKATPDTAVFAITVATTANNSNDAIKNAKTKVNSLLQELKSQGLTDSDFKLSPYNVAPTAGAGNTLIYAAGTTIIITSPNILLAENLISTSLNTGATLSVPLTYTVNDSNKSAYEKQAREQAIKNAQEKALDIAKSYHKNLGKMLSYTETPSTQNSLINSSSSDQPGEINITQTIQTTFQTK